MSAGWHYPRLLKCQSDKAFEALLEANFEKKFSDRGFPRLWTAILLAMAAFVLSGSRLGVSAQEANFNHRSPIPKFSLSASVQDTILSRDSGSLQNPGILTSLAPQPVPLPALPQRTALQKLPPVQADDDRPNSYLEEYNVSWSPWVTHLASKWHQILRGCEEVMGVEFHTPRPALIQFTCYADGHIGNVVLRQSSGIPVYDRLQVASLMEVKPLPFPPGTARKSVTLIQGWESHVKRPGEQDFQPWNFASQFPQERVSRWTSRQ